MAAGLFVDVAGHRLAKRIPMACDMLVDGTGRKMMEWKTPRSRLICEAVWGHSVLAN